LINVVQRKNREFEQFRTIDDVIAILKSQFDNRKLFIKYSVDRESIAINEYLDDNTLMVITSPGYVNDGNIIIFGLSDKYIEIDLEVIEAKGPGYFHCKVRSARRATTGRRDLRFKVSPDQVVATNFKVSKHSIDLTGFKMPTSIKVVLDQFQTTNSKMSDFIKVDIFDTASTDPIMGVIRKTGKTLFISDINDIETYRAITDDFVDLHDLYGKDLKTLSTRYVEKGYKSIVVVPIIYITENESSIPFGYIQLISKTENFDIGKVLDLKGHTFKLVDRIRDANTMLIAVHQEISDISRGGAKIKITDKNLKQYILKSKGFIFDLVFKLQAPITMYGDVKVTYTDDEGELYVGVDFEGNSSRKNEMKRFYSILKPMEVDYKQRLMKTMKSVKK
jgi:hypothetical protein